MVELENGRLIYHSVEPNTSSIDPDSRYAIADIAADEELTCNYAEFEPEFEICPGRIFMNGCRSRCRVVA